ncbi:MAG TPA: transglutaminase-like domain-containing protein [Prolixibacteraceae bacterium]|nr:transglutaminase-like domain-containing protein [Prolixibacteraceae bacterium]
MKDTKLDALITLLDDPDKSVFNLVLDELLKEDVSVVEKLEHIWETSLDELVQDRIEEIIQEIQLKDTKDKIKQWAKQETLDLFEGFFLISRHQYPEIKFKIVQAQMEKIRKDVWIEFRNSLTALEKISILNHIFYNHYKFTIDEFNPDDPQNSYINRILETRKANPVSIAILYTLVARLLELPVHYIDFPKNPLVGYFDKEIVQLAYGGGIGHSILFFINPSNKGAIIGPKEVDYIRHSGEEGNPQKLTDPCPDRIIIKRLIERLIIGYNELSQQEKVNYLKEIITIL